MRASLQYVEFSGFLLDLSDGVEKIRGCMDPDHFLYLGTRHLRRHAPAAYPLIGTGLEISVRSFRQLNTEMSHLQTACFVLIAFATGMRLSELLSLEEGCCQTETAPEQPDLVWLLSRVFKMQGVPDGRKARWLGGPVCIKAVQVLERLGKRVRRRAKVAYLMDADTGYAWTASYAESFVTAYDTTQTNGLRGDARLEGFEWTGFSHSSPHVPAHVCEVRRRGTIRPTCSP